MVEEIYKRKTEGYKRVFFYDDNFAISKERTKIMLECILKRKIKIKWSAEARSDIARDKELLKLMSLSNCTRMLIGFESVNPKTLAVYNKKQKVDDIKVCIKNLHAHGIKVHGMFVIGSDEDDSNTPIDTIKFCREMSIDSAQFSILHPLPGSKLYDILESENRIFTKNWSLYDGSHVVFNPKKINPIELQEKFFWLWKKFYSIRNPLYFAVARYIISNWHKSNRQALMDLKKRFSSAIEKTNLIKKAD